MQSKSNMVVNDNASRQSRLASTIFAWLLARHTWRIGGGWRSTAWHRIFDFGMTRFAAVPVTMNIHGQRALANFGHSYPLYARNYPRWNNPLLEIVAQAHRHKGRAINLIDVGAGIGDTVLLIEANLPHVVESYFCVEGDPEFSAFLEENTGPLGRAEVVNVMLDGAAGNVPGLVRSHPGTATASGTNVRQAVTLDGLVSDRGWQPVDVLKIDVDGFDGRVLCGARQLLADARPAVIFEWHPILCAVAKNSWIEHFDVLATCGYERFVWFTKFGDFSHFSIVPAHEDLESLAEFAERRVHDPDWHYDVVALHRGSAISGVDVATMATARRRRSWY